MPAHAAGAGANGNRREWRELDEIDHRERTVLGVPNVGAEMQVRPQERRTQFERHFTSGETGENHEEKNKAPVEAKLHRAIRINSACDAVPRRFAGTLP